MHDRCASSNSKSCKPPCEDSHGSPPTTEWQQSSLDSSLALVDRFPSALPPGSFWGTSGTPSRSYRFSVTGRYILRISTQLATRWRPPSSLKKFTPNFAWDGLSSPPSYPSPNLWPMSNWLIISWGDSLHLCSAGAPRGLSPPRVTSGARGTHG